MTRIFIVLCLTVVFCLESIPPVHASTAAGLETLVGIRGKDFVLIGADTAVGPGVIWTATRVDKIASIGSDSKTLVALVGDAADADFLINLLQARANLYEYQNGLGPVDYIRIEKRHNEKEGRPASTITITTTNEGNEYTVSDIAQLARQQIARQLRSPSQCRVCLLVAGLKENNGNRVEGTASIQRLQSQIRQASHLVGNKLVASASPVSATETALENSNEVVLPQLYWLDELGTMISVPYGSHGVGSMFMNSILDDGYHPNITRKEACALMQKCFQQLRQRYAVQTPQSPILKCIDRDGVHVLTLEDFN
jgi:20S proteasome subunit beta 4